MSGRSRLPKHIAQPAKGTTIATESAEAKGLRLLAMFRYMTERNVWTEGLTIDGAQYMVIRYRPAPHGPHNPDADLSGIDISTKEARRG